MAVAKIQQSLPEAKRDGDAVVSSLSGDLLYSESSTAQATTVLDQIDFIPRLMEKLKVVPDEVVTDLEELRRNRLLLRSHPLET